MYHTVWKDYLPPRLSLGVFVLFCSNYITFCVHFIMLRGKCAEGEVDICGPSQFFKVGCNKTDHTEECVHVYKNMV